MQGMGDPYIYTALCSSGALGGGELGVFYLQDCNDSSKTQGMKDPYIGSGADTPARIIYICEL